jgi:thiamine-phosphate pyrophosphorylase
MPTRPILYYITDSSSFAGDQSSRSKLLLDKIGEAVRSGIDFIQLREKGMPIPELEALTFTAVQILRDRVPSAGQVKTRLLINSRTDVAIACATDGVHLRSDDVSIKDAREIWGRRQSFTRDPEVDPVISVSCHSVDEVKRAARDGATYSLFGPVFEKRDASGVAAAGLEKLREACAANIPVLALGGITLQNARECIDAGAAGIAGIRLFQENNIEEVVRNIRF